VNARSHEEYKENIGAYVLGALPDLESELLERHLATCESCRAEVEELRPVTAAIGRSVLQLEPPPSLKASLMEVVNAEAAARADGTQPSRTRPALGVWFARLQPRMAAALAVGVLALGVVVGVAVDQLAGSGGSQATTVAAKIDRSRLPSGNATLAVDGSTGRLRMNGMPQPPPGRVYQLWYQHGTSIERGGTFRPGGDGSYRADLPVDGADAVMLTIERDGGAPAPTMKPIVQFTV
jgi:anti-sigma-K factor RskA